MYQLKDYLVVIPNAAPWAMCDDIIAEYSLCGFWKTATVGGDNVNTGIRNCKILGLSDIGLINKNLEKRKQLDNSIFDVVGKALKQYATTFPKVKIQEDTGYELLRYDEGGFYSTHTDNSISLNRTISCSIALNDSFEGGEFAFFDRGLKFKLNKGDAILFPSNFMYPHEIMPVISGVRYSIITWFR